MTTLFQAISVVIGIGIWVLLLYKASSLVPFSVKNMADRRRRVDEQLHTAEESKQRLAAVQRQIEANLGDASAQADAILVRARTEALAVADEVSKRGRADAAALVERARTDIGIERDRALQELRRQTADLIVRAAGAAVTSSLDADAHRRLITEALTNVAPTERN